MKWDKGCCFVARLVQFSTVSTLLVKILKGGEIETLGKLSRNQLLQNFSKANWARSQNSNFSIMIFAQQADRVEA